jgi:hypothetical protein
MEAFRQVRVNETAAEKGRNVAMSWKSSGGSFLKTRLVDCGCGSGFALSGEGNKMLSDSGEQVRCGILITSGVVE